MSCVYHISFMEITSNFWCWCIWMAQAWCLGTLKPPVWGAILVGHISQRGLFGTTTVCSVGEIEI